jgi:hypothetical protein
MDNSRRESGLAQLESLGHEWQSDLRLNEKEMGKNAIHVLGVALFCRRNKVSLVMESVKEGKRKHVNAAGDCTLLLGGNVGIPAPDVDEFVVHVGGSCGIAWKKKGQCLPSYLCKSKRLDVPGSESMPKTTRCSVL